MILVSTAELAAHLSDPNWIIFDCRHDLGDPAKGARVYAAGHLPGAHFSAVDTDLSGPKTGTNGRHPLPDPVAFVDFLARHGVSDATQVVAYDDVGGQYAARLWWMLRWVGLTRGALLDGGIPKWVAEGRPVTTALTRTSPVTWTPRPAGPAPWSAADVLARLDDRGSLLVDARAAERYRGEVEPIDAVAGHVPAAANRFYKLNLNADLTLRPAEELRREFKALIGDRSPEQVGHQCGSGITACANLFAMEYAGLTGSKLYAGSWSEWIADPTRPVAVG